MKTLKLDSSYKPIQVITVEEAFCMIWMNRANLVEVYDDVFLRSAHESFLAPCVVSVNRYINNSKFTLVCNRKNVIHRDNFTCQYCGIIFPFSQLTMDHIIPRSRGGLKTWDNIVASCIRCNQKKANKLPHEANMKLLGAPTTPPYQIFHTFEKDSIDDKWLPYLKIG